LNRGVHLKKQSISGETIRFLAAIIAVAFLNVGLYFLLYVLAPLISGLICGLIMREEKKGFLVGYIGSILAYFPLFVFLEAISPSTSSDLLVTFLAAGIISFLGGIGGFLGAIAVNRMTN
jgi:hypothetical protein